MHSDSAKILGIVFAALMGSLVLSSSALGANPYAPNVTAQHTSPSVTVTNGAATVDDTAITGVSVSVSGLTGASSVSVTTQSLNAPSSGVSAFSTSGTAVYFDVNITLPPGTVVPPGATATACFTNPSVTSSDILQYWDGTSWVPATNVSVTGTRICGTVPLSVLVGTNFVAAPPPAVPSPFPSLYFWGIVVAVVVVAIAVAIWVLRRPKRP